MYRASPRNGSVHGIEGDVPKVPGKPSSTESDTIFATEDDLCCLGFPFTLQDLCLLVVINDLDSYQLELLASLPRWLRHRLLSVLPALDLSRLEHTPVATGVDVQPLWVDLFGQKWDDKKPAPVAYSSLTFVTSGRYQRPASGRPSLFGHRVPLSQTEDVTQTTTRKIFPWQLSVCEPRETFPDVPSPAQLRRRRVRTSALHSFLDRPNQALMKEISVALRDVFQSETLPYGKECLFGIASSILTDHRDVDLAAAIHRVISIEGKLAFSNLLSGSMHEHCRTSECGQRVWRRQATALLRAADLPKTSNILLLHRRRPTRRLRRCYKPEKVEQDIYLTPSRLMPILNKNDPMELLSLLARECNLQPSSASIHIDSISQSFLLNMVSERFAFDNGIGLPSDDLSVTSIVNCLLEKVVILRLRCDSYSHIGVMVGMIEAATVDRENCQLKYFFCDVPNVYMDIVKPMSSVFSLQNFHQLTLNVSELYPLTLCKLLHDFMTTPCSHTQKLVILAEGIHVTLPKSLKVGQVAALYKGDSPTNSSLCICEPEHKVLQLSDTPKESSTCILYLLLQLPIIRLKEIVLSSLNEYYEYIHLCAVHPDLQMTKLVINLDQLCVPNVPTIQEDLISLFSIPSLPEIVVSGIWSKHDQIKLGLVQGLQNRSRLPPLKKLTLELKNSSYELRDVEKLFDAVFSLPQLENLKLVLGIGFGDLLRKPRCKETLHTSWSSKASNIQLKSISLQNLCNTEFELLSLIAQKVTSYSVSTPPPRPFTPSSVAFMDEPYYDDY